MQPFLGQNPEMLLLLGSKPQEKMRKLGRKSKLEKSGDFPLLFRFMEKLMRSHFQNKAELVEKRDQLFEKKVAVY